MALVETRSSIGLAPNHERRESDSFPIRFERISWADLESKKLKTGVIVLSDIHTGAGFSNLDKAVRVLKAVDSESVIVAGDFSEYRYPGKNFTEKEWNGIEKVRQAIGDRDFRLLPGNHDPELPGFVLREVGITAMADSPLLIDKFGPRIVIIHGHEGNGLFPKDGDPVRLVSDLAHNLTLKVRHLKTLHDVTGNLVFNLRGKVQKFAAGLAREHNAQIILHGHVHEVRESVVDGVRVINFGDFIHKNVSFATIDETGLVVYTVY
jgi:UDP-2,3-diacylglucosamine pyrophosphatase LpxH